MEPSGISTLLTVVGGIAFLWVFFYWLWRDFQTDVLREELFAVRDTLFELGAAGAIPFNHPAYGLTRGVINTAIQQAHAISLLSWIMTRSTIPNRNEGNTIQEIDDRWQQAYDSLPAESQKALRNIHDRIIVSVGFKVVMCSFPLFLITVVMALVVFVWNLFQLVVKNPLVDVLKWIQSKLPGSSAEAKLGPLLGLA